MLLRAGAVLAGTLALAGSVIAEGSTLRVEQRTPLSKNGKWILATPAQESIRKGGPEDTLTGLAEGQYTIFTEAPEGTTVTFFVYEGDAIAEKIDLPQYSFRLDGVQTLHLVIQYRLTRDGTVTVLSAPSGVPFELRGPNDLRIQGIAPETYDQTPAGQYSVTYFPPGCPTPRPQALMLQSSERITFTIDVECATLTIPKEQNPEDELFVYTVVNGKRVALTDVPKDAWFSSYVTTVAKLGVLSGYRDSLGEATGLFGPENSVTAAELAKMAHEAAGIDEMAFSGELRNRTAANQWFSQYALGAQVQGWAIYGDDTLDFARPVTRTEVIVTLLQASGVPLQWQRGGVFVDVPTHTPFAAAIETAYRTGLVEGVPAPEGPERLFEPEKLVNRAEMSKILVKAMEIFRKETR